MLYMVEIDFTSAEHEEEWSTWYSTHLGKLLTVPGFETAQRFQATNSPVYTYLAFYSVTSFEVYTSEAYRSVGGGGGRTGASGKWFNHIRRRRNLFAGLERAPEITDGARLLVTEGDPARFDLPDLVFVPLSVAALDGTPTHRHIAVASAERAERPDVNATDGLRAYKPMTPRLLPQR